MPLVDYGDSGISPQITAIDISDAPKAETPAAMSILGAAARQSNIVGSTLSSETAGLNPYLREEGFDPFEAAKGTKYEPYADQLAGIFNREYYEAWQRQIDKEEEDRRTLENAGWWGTTASAVAAIADLPSIIPGGAVIRSARGGLSVGRTAGVTALAGGAAGAVSEAGLQATQELRTKEESAIAIGSGVVFGALLGGGVGAVMSRAETMAATKAIDDVRNVLRSETSLTPVADEVEEYAGQLASAGAAARDADTLDDLTIAGKATESYGRSIAQINPLLRALNSPSVKTREIMTGLMENPVYLKKNTEGRGDAAVETVQKYWERGAFGSALEDHLSLWKEARKAGIKMTREEFSRAVGQAMRRGDTGVNDYVSRAARNWRSKLVDPLKVEAQGTGQLPEDLPSRFDETYLHRIYRADKIKAQEPQFKAAIRPYIEKSVDDAIRAQEAGEAINAPAFVSDADREAYIEDVMTDIFNKITGVDQTDIPYGIVSVQQGPLKERTLRVPDKVLEPWLEDDVELINNRYARRMGADVELARKFGRADMKDQLDEIKQDYSALKKGVTGEKELTRLNNRMAADIRDLQAVRDLLRGNYRPEENATNFARVLRSAGTFNYMRAMGGVVVSSLTDAVRPAMVHGVSAYFRDGIAPLVRNLEAINLSKKDAKLAGAISERILQSRMATMAELTDPYSHNSPFERLLDNAANKFTTLTGMNHWNDFQKSIAAVMTQNRVLKNAAKGLGNLKDGERSYMAFLGIDDDMAQRVADQFGKYGQTLDGIRVANTEQWDDVLARRAYYAAINKDVDGTIVTRGVGDVPLFINRPLGRALLQFKSFALASNQRVLMRGMQESSARLTGGIVGMAAIGAFVYYLKQVESGRPVSNNPGTWAAEGLDRSGIFSIGFEINNAIEKAGGPGVYSALAAAGRGINPNADMAEPASRFATRTLVEGFLGPSIGLANETVGLASVGLRSTMGDTDVTAGDIGTMRRLAPFASLPYWRWAIDGGFGAPGIVPALKEAVE